jgi:mannose-6-phosphate isomerase-like protein (cupin superfamily)
MSSSDEKETVSDAGPGHNSEKPVIWEAWQKKRTFVRALEGTYSHLTKELLDQPRIYSSTDMPWKKHGHLNSACFYVLRGSGYDIHDGRRIEWKAGDVMLVENGCVHQHFAYDEGAVMLVFKAKPLFLFMHLLFQKVVDYPPSKLLEGHENWQPPEDL